MSINNDASLTNPKNHEKRPSIRKRTRDEVDEVELDRRPFTIRDPNDPFARPRTFTPICLLSRAQLPLAYLDTSTFGSRLFSACINTLETCNDGTDDVTTVLIAQDDKKEELYAIERVKQKTYALCRLGEWVKPEDLQATAKTILRTYEPQAKRRALQPIQNSQPWWSQAAVEMPSAAVKKDPTRAVLPTLAMSRVMDAPQRIATTAAGPETRPAVAPVTDMPEEDVGSAETSLAPLDILQELSKHYIDTLYLSRTSLAYFTKGPLSRARAAFTRDTNANMTELSDFLRDCVLTSTTMDKKYRDGLVTIIKDLPVRTPDTPEQQAKAKKKWKKWKPKRDRGGLFVGEQEIVAQWWKADDDTSADVSSAETLDTLIQRRLPKIRTRETFLQIIIGLEILALEASAEHDLDDKRLKLAPQSESQANETQATDTQPVADAQKSKAKKKQDLPALLETLLDKLCIWHSLEGHSPAKKAGKDPNTSQDEANDELRSFCIEVIVPFYVSRIPSCAAIVNKKLGGPSAPSPVKGKQSSIRRPGEPAFRQQQQPEKRTRQPLARVSTDTLNQFTKRPPSLHRSPTDSDALTSLIKRESSEVPQSLSSIPPARPQHRQRASLVHQYSFNKREVDLSAMSQVSEAKMRKKADVEQKLKEAISTLKKPNRAMAVKEIANSTDESFAKATNKSRSQRAKTVANVAATPKHVKATPYRRVAARSGPGTTHVPSSSAKLMAEPPTSSFAVPATCHRPRHGTTNVEETPSRGFAKFMPLGLARQPGTLEFDSPVASRKTVAAIRQTPSKPLKSLAFGPVEQVGVTPLRPPARPLVAASPNVRWTRDEEGGAAEPEALDSIYDTLGWNENHDELY